MKLNTVIFDMDGLLIDSEPLWNEAADEVFEQYNLKITKQQHLSTTGMRTKEFVQWWFGQYNIPLNNTTAADEAILNTVIEKVQNRGMAMPGLQYIFNFFLHISFKISSIVV